VVADALLEGLTDELAGAGFGVIQLPPAGLGRRTRDAWLEQVAEHVAEFVRTGYEVVLADDGSAGGELEGALAALGVPPLAPYVAAQ
jgi:hypothetical protein